MTDHAPAPSPVGASGRGGRPGSGRLDACEAASLAAEPPSRSRGGLAGWQLRRVSLRLEGDLAGLDVAALAREVGLSRDHFAHAYRHSAGHTPGHALRRARIDRAKTLLDTTPLSIGSIARLVGYSGAPQLQRPFAAETSLSPLAWRRRA